MTGLVRHLFISAAIVLCIANAGATAAKPPVNKGDDDVAIKGYDTVAYVTAGRAVAGTSRFEYSWNGARWRFANAENRGRFIRQPERYAPQFGGYCSWAVSRGYTADVDPESFRIVDGRLYLIYSKTVQRRWEQDIPGNIAKAQANWPSVLNK